MIAKKQTGPFYADYLKQQVLTPKQKNLLMMYAKKHQVSYPQLESWIEHKKVSFTELAQGILGKRVA